MKYNDIELKGLGHASFKVKFKDYVIYIDPYNIEDDEPADLILITHEHYDHCSPNDINKLTTEKTLIIAPKSAASKLRGNVRVTKVDDKIELGICIIESVEAYNTDKPFHPRGLGVGYIININNTRIYHTGDTDLIPEMKKIIDIDIAFFPVSGVYVMNADEAAEAAEIIKPKVAVPMHYGGIVGDISDADNFSDLVTCNVMILSQKECKPGECENRED